jgi:hypothetical protein
MGFEDFIKFVIQTSKNFKRNCIQKWWSCEGVCCLFVPSFPKDIYRMCHEKVARLPFCTSPCDILSGVSMHIASSVLTVNQQACCHHPPNPQPPTPAVVRHRLATLRISVFTLCYGPGLLFRGPLCMYIHVSHVPFCVLHAPPISFFLSLTSG